MSDLYDIAVDLSGWGLVDTPDAALRTAQLRTAGAREGTRWRIEGAPLDALVAAAADAEVVAVDHSLNLEFTSRYADALGLPMITVTAEEEAAAELGPYDGEVRGARQRLRPYPWSTGPPPDEGGQWTFLGEGGDAVVWQRGAHVARFVQHPALVLGYRREHALLRWLSAQLPAVPTSLSVTVSPNCAVLVQPFCAGQAMGPTHTGPLAAELGAWLGALHGLAYVAAPAEAKVNLRFDTSPSRLLRRLRLGRTQEQLSDGAPPPLHHIFSSTIVARIEAFLLTPPPICDTLAMIHGDLTPEHLRLDDAGRLMTILDWTDASVGDPMRDLGYLAMWGGDCFFADVLAAYPRALSAADAARLQFHRQRESLLFLVEGPEDFDPITRVIEAFS